MNSNRELHYRYAISALLVLVVLTSAVYFYQVPKVVELLSFAATLTALVLALVAIIYTIVTTQKQDQQLTRLVETDAKISAAAEKITETSIELRAFATEAPEEFQAIKRKLDALGSGTIADYDGEARLEEAEEQSGGTARERGDWERTKDVFVKLQFRSLPVLYAFMMAYRSNRALEPDLMKQLFASKPYADGVLDGLRGGGVLDYKRHNRAVIPVMLDSAIESNLDDLWDVGLDVLDDDEVNREFLKSARESIQAEFSSGSEQQEPRPDKPESE